MSGHIKIAMVMCGQNKVTQYVLKLLTNSLQYKNIHRTSNFHYSPTNSINMWFLCFCRNEIRRGSSGGTVDVISVHFFFDGEIRLQFMIVTFSLSILPKSVRNILYNYKRCLRYIYLFDLSDTCHKYFWSEFLYTMIHIDKVLYQTTIIL